MNFEVIFFQCAFASCPELKRHLQKEGAKCCDVEWIAAIYQLVPEATNYHVCSRHALYSPAHGRSQHGRKEFPPGSREV